jgi:hypothetical protein
MAVFESDFNETLAKYEQAADQAEAEAIKRGLYVTNRPDMDRPELPSDISELSLTQLRHLLMLLTGWHTYAVGQKALADSRRRAAEKKRNYAWSAIRRVKNGTVSDKDDSTTTDTRYINLDVEAEKQDYLCKILECTVAGLYREVETISRTFSMMEQRAAAEGAVLSADRMASASRPRVDAFGMFRAGRRK